MEARSANTLSSNSNFTVASGATLNFGSFNATIDSLSARGNVALDTTMLIAGTLERGDTRHPGAGLTPTNGINVSGTLAGHGTTV